MNNPTTPNFRINADQVIDFTSDRGYIVKYLGKCPVLGTRLYDMPGDTFLEHQPVTFIAAEHDMTGPDFLASWLACNNSEQVYEKALALAKTSWLPGPAMVGETKLVRMTAKRWFDLVKLHTYFTAVAVVNGEIVARIGVGEGYAEEDENLMADNLEVLGFLPGRLVFDSGRKEPLGVYAKRMGIVYEYEHTNVTLRIDL